MAVTIVATAGASDANSFCTLAEAETYMDGRLNSTDWSGDTDANKNIALVEATREIDALGFIGQCSTDTQALAWPRQWAVDPDDPTYNYFDTDEVPQRVKDATMELAFQFLKAGTTDLAALDAKANIKRSKVDVLETEYFAANSTPQGLARYPRVLNWLRPLLGGSPVGAEVVRG